MKESFLVDSKYFIDKYFVDGEAIKIEKVDAERLKALSKLMDSSEFQEIDFTDDESEDLIKLLEIIVHNNGPSRLKIIILGVLVLGALIIIPDLIFNVLFSD